MLHPDDQIRFITSSFRFALGKCFEKVRCLRDLARNVGIACRQARMIIKPNWAKANCMTLSPAKCAVLLKKGAHHDYFIDGRPLPVTHCIRDLGVLMTADLRLREQVDAVVASTNLLGNMILRTFAIRSASFYLNLYRSLVVPRLTYCSTIWTQFLKRDVHFSFHFILWFIHRNR